MRRALRRLFLLGAALVLATAAAVVWTALSMQERHGGGGSLEQPVDAAIVLGSGVDPDGILHYSSRRRVAAAVELLESGGAKRLVMSGGAVRWAGASAAALMREHAIALGAPPDAVLLEERSGTTFENLRFSFEIARNEGLGTLAIVSDDTHLTRAAWLACYFDRCGIGLVSVNTLRGAGWIDQVLNVGRETMAWWYNLGKVALWSLSEATGVPVEERGIR